MPRYKYSLYEAHPTDSTVFESLPASGSLLVVEPDNISMPSRDDCSL